MVRISKAEKAGFGWGTIIGVIIAGSMYGVFSFTGQKSDFALGLAVLLTIGSVVITPFLAYGKLDIKNSWKGGFAGTTYGFTTAEWVLVYFFHYAAIQH